MILCRENELRALNKLYEKETNEAVIIYGKTNNQINELVKEFLNNKEFFYYNALPVSKELQEILFYKEISSQISGKQLLGTDYNSVLHSMLEVKCEKRVVVISNFQNIIKYNPDFISTILNGLHDKWNNQKVLFLLVSENQYFVEKQMIEKINEYAYEISGLIRIDDLSFIDFVKNLNKYSMTDLISVYSIIGGRSGYIKEWDANKSVKENIIDKILTKNSFFYNKGQHMLPDELREHSVYNTLLFTIASGKEKLNDIHKATGYSRAKISVYLNNLHDFDLVEKIESFDSPGRDLNALKGIYRIKDRFTYFYYKFIYPHFSELEISDNEAFYSKYIEKYLISFSADAFKTVCIEYIMLLNKMHKLPFEFNEFGAFLGKVGNIDIVASDKKGNNLIGLCNYENEVMTLEDFEWLCFCVKQAKLSDDVFYLFSRVSFDERLIELAKNRDNIYLIDLEML